MNRELITFENTKSPVSEAFKVLRTNIQFMTSNKNIKTILITSCTSGDGKSLISSNLAVAFAQAGKKVLIIDANLRKGRLYNIFQIKATPGLSNYLSGINSTGDESETNIIKYVQETKIENLFVIPAGDIPPNPSELLISDKMQKMIQILKESFDIIIFNGTPSETIADSVIISTLVDSTILVASYKKTKMDTLKKVQKNIQNVGGNIAGVIINRYPNSFKKYEKQYYNLNTPIKIKNKQEKNFIEKEDKKSEYEREKTVI